MDRLDHPVHGCIGRGDSVCLRLLRLKRLRTIEGLVVSKVLHRNNNRVRWVAALLNSTHGIARSSLNRWTVLDFFLAPNVSNTRGSMLTSDVDHENGYELS